jgi:hypothetical protein
LTWSSFDNKASLVGSTSVPYSDSFKVVALFHDR